jgi:gliding motility-associated-like protein
MGTFDKGIYQFDTSTNPFKTFEVEMFDDVATCENYQLSELSPGNGYYTEISGSRTELQAGQLITNSQTIFVFNEGNVCANESSFSVSINDSNCEEQITTIDYQKFFTPNGDGINDFWQFSETLINNMLVEPIFIYNKYGKLLFQLDANDLGWDGNYNGTKLPASDYWFVVKIDDDDYFKGHFALKR